jgi:hypothetical protein
VKRITRTSEVFVEIGAKFGSCYLCGSTGLHISHLLCENVDESSPDSVEIICKECSSRRRKRPISVYLGSRFSEVATEYARISLLLAPKEHISGITKAISDFSSGVVGESPNDVRKSTVNVEKLQQNPEKYVGRNEIVVDDEDATWDEYIQSAREAEEKTQSSPPISENTPPKSEVTKPDLQELVDGWDEEE